MSAPATPANLSIDVIASNMLNLSWDNVAGETGFYLYRSLDDVTYNILVALDADVLAYWDDAVDFSTQYYYKVSAYNNDGESALSSSVNTTTLAKDLKKYWEGQRGPFYYDANARYKNEDVAVAGFRSEGSIMSGAAPALGAGVLRKDDIGLAEGKIPGWVTTPPTSPGDTGSKGFLAVDAGFFYVCRATNTWIRFAITGWTPPEGNAGVPMGFSLLLTYAT